MSSRERRHATHAHRISAEMVVDTPGVHRLGSRGSHPRRERRRHMGGMGHRRARRTRVDRSDHRAGPTPAPRHRRRGHDVASLPSSRALRLRGVRRVQRQDHSLPWHDCQPVGHVRLRVARSPIPSPDVATRHLRPVGRRPRRTAQRVSRRTRGAPERPYAGRAEGALRRPRRRRPRPASRGRRRSPASGR